MQRSNKYFELLYGLWFIPGRTHGNLRLTRKLELSKLKADSRFGLSTDWADRKERVVTHKQRDNIGF
jgi:hypothetical protein